MLTRTPIYPDKDFVCNNRNVHEYTPYIISDNNNIIDITWWNSLTPYCQELIKIRTDNNFVMEDVKIPHVFQFDNKEKFLGNVYRSYIESFDFHIWYPQIKSSEKKFLPKDVHMIYISNELKKLFVKIYEIQDSWYNYVDNLSLKQFYDELKLVMISGNEYFVRMSSTSGKNEESIKIFTDINDILDHITGMKLFVDQEYKYQDKDSYMILMPFNHKIQAKYEFRIFVVNNKLTGISQQNSYELHNYSKDELDDIERVLNNISFLESCPYRTYVADVYIDMEANQCNLIECNPFGAHCGAGSALFNWITDYDMLYNLTSDLPELRYLSVIKI